VVRELTADNADIEWTAHVANRKAEWYQFQLALDIPDAAGQAMTRRNPDVLGAARSSLAIDPGPRSISGKNVSGGPEHAFDTGKFKDTIVPLGEIRTDPAGRLLFLGGLGKSASPSGAPIITSDPNSFNNANDWYDDISDGPVTAKVSISGRPVAVDHAWVVVAPPNYGTDVVGWRTMYDLLVDTYVGNGWLPMTETVSFANDILPFLRRLSNLQWVNKGFAAIFGKDGPMDFENSVFVGRLAKAPPANDRNGPADTWAELRRAVFNAFRPFDTASFEPRLWPWLYGDAFGSSTPNSPLNVLQLPAVQQVMLRRWADGDFIGDWDPNTATPHEIGDVPLAAQPAMLDQAALHFCLADAFHPGCEMTWPVRHPSIFEKPFRFRLQPEGQPASDYGSALTPAIAMTPGGPLFEQGPGTISRWMALPWQGDTAFCRSGYPGYLTSFDPYVPTFWPARVPNQVLTAEDYAVVMDLSRSREERLAAFNNRASWNRGLPTDVASAMMKMVADFGHMGVVEARPGIPFDPTFLRRSPGRDKRLAILDAGMKRYVVDATTADGRYSIQRNVSVLGKTDHAVMPKWKPSSGNRSWAVAKTSKQKRGRGAKAGAITAGPPLLSPAGKMLATTFALSPAARAIPVYASSDTPPIHARSVSSSSCSGSRASASSPINPSALSSSASRSPSCSRPSALSRSRSGRSRRVENPNASRNFLVVT
jgi:L-Lysine epsilon oxidase N-terminal/L-lysine epsilon oxidase C-terminal domain